MKRLLAGSSLLGLAAIAAGLFITRPQPLDATLIAALPNLASADPVAGEHVFWTAGCASCHAAPEASDEERIILGGGLALKTDFGTFVAPNISSSPENGIGAWSLTDFANAMQAGVSPNGEHYYPSFPYGSYSNMTGQDLTDLFAFMKTLPGSDNVPAPNDLKFPFSIRASIGGWKLLFFDDGLLEAELPVIADAAPQVLRGQYLVAGPAHCGECHSPRNVLGGFTANAWLSGAENPDGDGRIPNITSGAKDISGWSIGEIADYLQTGFTPDFDSVGGSMVSVQKNMAKLPRDDLEAIAAYLKAVPAIENN